MTTSPLKHDALRATAHGFELRLGLPWIRALPFTSVSELRLSVDGEPVEPLHVAFDQRRIDAADLAREPGWWHMQEHLTLEAPRRLTAGAHAVEVALTLLVPYLAGGPSAPLVLPLFASATLTLDTN